MPMRDALAVIVALAFVLAPACAVYGTDNTGTTSSADAAPPTSPRSVRCGAGQPVTDAGLCCLTDGGTASCAASCSDTPLTCDDTADCGGSGSVCCVDLLIGPLREQRTINGTTCRAPEQCQLSAAGPKSD